MEELSSLTPIDLKPGFTSESFEELVEPLRTGKKEKIEFTTVHRRKDGSLYDAEVHLQLSIFKSVPVFVAIIHDITKRKQAGEEISKLSQALKESPSIFMITDTKGNIEFVNPIFTQLTGYTNEEVIGQNPRFLKSNETTPEEYKRLWETITTGGRWKGELCNKKKNGELYWESASISSMKNSDGVITNLIKVAEDITERKHDEQLLRLQATIINQIHDSVVSTDLDGFVTSWNKGAERLFGYSSDEMLSRHITVLYQEEDHEFLKNKIIAPLQAKGEHELDVRMRNKSGKYFYAHLALSMLNDEHGKVTGMIGYSMDITERVQVESKLRKYRRPH
jgi:sigma-B regulation protein RsbU (phosphoserine phosphatase)